MNERVNTQQDADDWAVVDSRRAEGEATAISSSSLFYGVSGTPFGNGDDTAPPNGKMIWREFGAVRNSAVSYLNQYLECLDNVDIEEPGSGSSAAVSRAPRSSNMRAMDLKVCADTVISDLYQMEDMVAYVLQNMGRSKPSFSPVAVGCTATFSASAILIPAKYTAALALSATGAVIAGAAVAVPRAGYEWRIRSIRSNHDNLRKLRIAFEESDVGEIERYQGILDEWQFKSLRWTLRSCWPNASLE